MPTFRVETEELWETEGVYYVIADSPEEAVKQVKNGTVECYSHEHPGNDDRFISAEVEYE